MRERMHLPSFPRRDDADTATSFTEAPPVELEGCSL